MADNRLTYRNAPPLSVPVRFFLAAPLFMLLAAMLLGWRGPALLQWRGDPVTLAVTHLITIGFISQVMLGALFQLIPVLCGSAIAAPIPIGTIVQAGLAAGTLLFCAGLVTGGPALVAGAVMLGATFTLFIAAAGWALARAPWRGPGTATIPLAVIALLPAVMLGMLAALARSGFTAGWPPIYFPGAHVGWAVAGWVGLLIIGVSFHVVPMFQLTPDYPVGLRRLLGPTLFAALIGWTISTGLRLPAALMEWLIALSLLVFAGTTLLLQRWRRRQVPDVTLRSFAAGLLCLMAAVAAWAVQERLPAAGRGDILAGILLLAGFAQFVIIGMLLKIVPFLCWLHLNNAGIRGAKLRDFIGPGAAQAQYLAHLAAVGALAAAVFQPALARPAAAAYAASAAMLLANLIAALRRYRAERRKGPVPRAVPPWRQGQCP